MTEISLYSKKSVTTVIAVTKQRGEVKLCEAKRSESMCVLPLPKKKN